MFIADVWVRSICAHWQCKYQDLAQLVCPRTSVQKYFTGFISSYYHFSVKEKAQRRSWDVQGCTVVQS